MNLNFVGVIGHDREVNRSKAHKIKAKDNVIVRSVIGSQSQPHLFIPYELPDDQDVFGRLGSRIARIDAEDLVASDLDDTLDAHTQTVLETSHIYSGVWKVGDVNGSARFAARRLGTHGGLHIWTTDGEKYDHKVIDLSAWVEVVSPVRSSLLICHDLETQDVFAICVATGNRYVWEGQDGYDLIRMAWPGGKMDNEVWIREGDHVFPARVKIKGGELSVTLDKSRSSCLPTFVPEGIGLYGAPTGDKSEALVVLVPDESQNLTLVVDGLQQGLIINGECRSLGIVSS